MNAAATHPNHRSDDFSRGLGVLLFRNRSMGRALTLFVLLTVLLWLFLVLSGVFVLHTQAEIGAALTYGWAGLLLELTGRDLGQWPVWTTAGWEKWYPSEIRAQPSLQNSAGAVGRTLLWSLVLATVATIPLSIGAHRGVKSFGRRMLTGKYLRGAVKLEDQELARLVRKKRQATPIRIGSIPLPAGSECEHLAFIGAPGTGKSQAIMGLLDAIRERGDAAVIYDSKGTFTAYYYDAQRGDILLNPLDKRSPAWTPWAEIEDEMDADRLAKALIPAGDHSTPFFSDTARAMLSAAFSKMLPRRGREPSLEQLLQLLLHGSPEKREAFYRNTDVTQIFDRGGERMRVSVEQNLRTYLRSLRHLPLAEKGDGEQFSILRHIQGIDRRERQPWLFLPSPLRVKHTSIQPLLTCWMDCAAAAILSLGERRERRCWVIVDEVKSLYRLPSLPDLMAEGRGFGACVVLGFQDLAQLRDVYGPDAAKSMSAVLGTKVLFKIADPETAKWGADVLGEVEEEIVKESTRYDAAGDTPKGVQLASQRVIRHLVMPAQLQRQPAFTCWVQLSGEWPIAQTRLPHPATLQREVIAPQIAPADPERSYAARIADVPDLPPAPETAPAAGTAASQPGAASTAASATGKDDNDTAATAPPTAGTPVAAGMKAGRGMGKGGC
ncbi:MAG: type IV secretion system DNA-binding domain-containing protein [Geminicoccaceae bacterium]